MLMDQSSRDDTVVGVTPPRPPAGDAVSHQSSKDKRTKRSPAEASDMEGKPISERRERPEVRPVKAPGALAEGVVHAACVAGERSRTVTT